MKKLLPVALLLVIAGLLYADDRGRWSGGGHNVTVDVNPGIFVHKVNVSANGLTSAWADATNDPAGDSYDILESDEMSVNGNVYKFAQAANGDGRLYYKDTDGKWKRMKPLNSLSTEGQGSLPKSEWTL